MSNKDLTGLAPVDWDEMHRLYPGIKGYEGNKLKILPRDNILISLVTGGGVNEEVDLEDICKDLIDGSSPVAKELRTLAKKYITFKNKAARLPKFGKWVNSMFGSRPELNVELAKLGQIAATKPSEITISCHPADMLRGGLGKHFMTCLGPKGGGGYYNGGYANVIPAVLEEVSGAAIAYIESDDPNGAYKCRAWIHHIEVDGKPAIQVNTPYGNGFTHKQIANLIASKGYDVYSNGHSGEVKFSWVNNFKRTIHWDAIEMGTYGTLLAKATGTPAVLTPAKKAAKKRVA